MHILCDAYVVFFIVCFLIALLPWLSCFNVDEKNKMSFSGPVEDLFGYTVQQFENSEGKWVLIGSPLTGQPAKRTGDVYRCPVGQNKGGVCEKFLLPGHGIVGERHLSERPDKGTASGTAVGHGVSPPEHSAPDIGLPVTSIGGIRRGKWSCRTGNSGQGTASGNDPIGLRVHLAWERSPKKQDRTKEHAPQLIQRDDSGDDLRATLREEPPDGLVQGTASAIGHEPRERILPRPSHLRERLDKKDTPHGRPNSGIGHRSELVPRASGLQECLRRRIRTKGPRLGNELSASGSPAFRGNGQERAFGQWTRAPLVMWTTSGIGGTRPSWKRAQERAFVDKNASYGNDPGIGHRLGTVLQEPSARVHYITGTISAHWHRGTASGNRRTARPSGTRLWPRAPTSEGVI
ncbi:hypothetical protein cypCar_00008078 [Cyprinus carpio]|nr:hypothetical protein cypCar_00008078 [Cyprinus carpio]